MCIRDRSWRCSSRPCGRTQWGGAVGVTGKPPDQSETSGVPRGAPAEGEWRAVQRKDAAMR
eukprot:7125618-Alexandrium_andersonii.AAC.1